MAVFQKVSNWILGEYKVRTVDSVASGAGGNSKVQVVTQGFSLPDYDYVGVTYPTTSTEVYVFKTGGSGGTTAGTITLTYSDAVTKAILTTAVKT